MMFYLRWRVGEPRVSRSFPNIASDHPLAKERCPACGDVFQGQPIVLVVIGPGADPEATAKAREGRWFNAVALPVHEACCVTSEYLVKRVDPDTDGCPDCEGEVVWDEDAAHLVCSACGQFLKE